MTLVAPMIDARRLGALMATFGQFGGATDGGMHRLALSAEDGQARDEFARWISNAGLKATVDPMGNMFGATAWAGDGAPMVMMGSHLDSQPHGGRLDGAYGVLAACEAFLAVAERLRREGTAPRCDLALVNWTNEEGARFQPSILGSSVYAGLLDRDYALGRTDGDGVSVREALRAIGYAGTGQFPKPQAYLELHVECNDVLESKGLRFGAVARHWGAIKYRLAMIGRQAHTGATPMADRRDALLGAARLIDRIRALAEAAPALLHASVGRLEVRPNSPNVVPGEAVMFIELRSAEQEAMDWAEAELLRSAEAIAASAGLTFEIRAVDHRAVGYFDAGLIALATEEASTLAVATETLDCVAANDANCMIPICPSVVLNVPSVGGLCHHPAEHTEQVDLELGADLLARVVWRLCRDGLPSASRP